MIKYKKILANFKAVSIYVWILLAIIIIGIFLRTYRFHDWLEFRNDQERDASIVSQVVTERSQWPLMGPYMSYSGDGDHVETNSFHVGPMYYYFQIISAKIFGDYPDKLAYPDVFFAILSIPLFFFFLNIYFKKNLSLGITGLYAISAYFIQYSRFAWNTNLIPFFVLLFLLSLYKFLIKNEKTHWIWVILLGVALGIGFQLHAIVMILFSITTFFIFLFSMKKNYKAWKKWAVVLLIFIALNSSQIISEIKTNFSNTKVLLNFSFHNNNNEKIGKLTLIKNDINCYIEANAYFLSSYGNSNCTYSFLNPTVYSQINTKNFSKFSKDFVDVAAMLTAIAFFGTGYFLLIAYGKKEEEKKKRYFLRLIFIYSISVFLIMIPLSMDKFDDLRYLMPIFFMPFMFLGFLIKFICEKVSNKNILLISIGIIFLLLIYTNSIAIFKQASSLISKDRTCNSYATTLGELEPVAEYMISNSDGKGPIYFGGDRALHVVKYILRKHYIDSIEINKNPDLFENNGPAYIASCKSNLKNTYPYKKIGSIFVFRLNN